MRVVCLLFLLPTAALADEVLQAAEIHVVDGRDEVTARDARMRVTITPPDAPSRTHECKRVDVYSALDSGRGGEWAGKGECGRPTQDFFIQVPHSLFAAAKRKCEQRWARTEGPKPNQIKAGQGVFRVEVSARWCFLDMKPRVKRKRGGVSKRWHVDCGKDGIWKRKTVQVTAPFLCRQPLKKADHSSPIGVE